MLQVKNRFLSTIDREITVSDKRDRHSRLKT